MYFTMLKKSQANPAIVSFHSHDPLENVIVETENIVVAAREWRSSE